MSPRTSNIQVEGIAIFLGWKFCARILRDCISKLTCFPSELAVRIGMFVDGSLLSVGIRSGSLALFKPSRPCWRRLCFFWPKPDNLYKQVMQKTFEQLRSTVNDNRKPQSTGDGIPRWLRGFGELPLFGHADAESADTTQACSMNGSLRIKHGKFVLQSGKVYS